MGPLFSGEVFLGWLSKASMVLALGFAPVPSHAVEQSMIAPVSGQGPMCTSVQYIEISGPMIGTMSKGPCDSCKSAVESAKSSANGALASGQAADSATSASSSAGTAMTAAQSTGFQKNAQGSASTVDNIGQNGLQQHAASAQKTSAAMKQCSQQIKSSCSGGLAGEDKSAADQVAQDCDRAGQQADQVAAEKNAKAGEMGKNEGKSAGNEDKLGQMPQMPQMPQGGGGGGAGAGSGLSGSDLNSNLATSTATEKNLETAKLASTKGASLPMFTGTEGVKVDMENATNGESTDTGISQAQSNAPGSGGGAHGRAVAAENGSGGASSGGPLGVSLGGSAGGAGAGSSGGTSGQSGAGAAGGGAPGTLLGTAAGDAMVPYTSSGSSSYAPLKSAVLGLATDGQELKEFVASAALDGSSGAAGASRGPLHDRQGGLTKAINEQSLFQRVSFRIRRISADRTMQ